MTAANAGVEMWEHHIEAEVDRARVLTARSVRLLLRRGADRAFSSSG